MVYDLRCNRYEVLLGEQWSLLAYAFGGYGGIWWEESVDVCRWHLVWGVWLSMPLPMY